jgi:uncharacterized protein YegP (UPF0339 family)
MSIKKQTRKAGIHLLKTTVTRFKGKTGKGRDEFYWNLVASNGRIIARSSETYTERRGAINSIRVASDVFRFEYYGKYYDHSGANVEVKSIVK